MKLRCLLAVLASLIGLTGCSAPRVNRGEEATRFAQVMQSRLADLQLDTAKPLTLADCEVIAVKNNLSYRVKLLEVRLADEQVRLKMSGWLPSAQAEFDRVARNNPPLVRLGNSQPLLMQDQRYDAFNLRAILPIFDFGATYLAWTTAKDRRSQAQLAVVRARQTLLRDVRVAYAQYAATVRQEKLSQVAVDAALEVLRVSKSMEREGLSSRADTAFVESALAQAALQLALVRSSVAELRLRLSETLSLPSGVQFTIETALPALPPVPVAADVAKLEDNALQARPELFSQDLEQHVAANAVRQKIVDFFPQVNGVLDFNWSTQSFQVNPTFYDLGFSVAQSLLDGGARIFRLREAQKNVTVEKERALLVAIGILYDVDLRTLQLVRARDVMLATDVLVASEQTLLTDVESRMREGLESGADAAKALADLRAAELQQDRARTDYLTFWYELEAAALCGADTDQPCVTAPAETVSPAPQHDDAKNEQEGKVN